MKFRIQVRFDEVMALKCVSLLNPLDAGELCLSEHYWFYEAQIFMPVSVLI